MEDQVQPGGIISPTQPPSDDAQAITVRVETTKPAEVATAPEAAVSEPVASVVQDTPPVPVAIETTAPTVDSVAAVETPIETQPIAPAEAQPAAVTEAPVAQTETPQPSQEQQPESAAPEAQPQTQPTPEPQPTVAAEASEPVEAMPPIAAFMNPDTPPSVPAPQPKSKNKLKLAGIVAAAIVLVGGGSAAAYLGVMVPNKPENKILSAVTDLISRKSLTTTGIIDYTPVDGGLGVSVTYKMASNSEKSQLSLAGTLGANGAQFPYEMRFLDKSMYLKVGGLDGVSKLMPTTSGGIDYAKIVKGADDQWYVIDSSIFNAAGVKATCITDLSLTLSSGDIDMISAAYKKHPLFKVKSSVGEVVDGTATTKYVVDPASDSEASAFAGELKNLSIVKKVQECVGTSAGSVATSGKSLVSKESASGTIAMYVTGKKQLKKLEIITKDKTASMKINAVFSYDAVNVTKPDDAKPMQDLLSSLTGGLLSASTQSTAVTAVVTPAGTAKDTERKADINALHGQSEAFYAQYGYYPSLADLNSSTFRAAKFVGLDKEALKDPTSSSYAIVAAPQKGAYSYAPTPANCDNASKGQCTGYTLTATLENGSTYVKKSLN